MRVLAGLVLIATVAAAQRPELVQTVRPGFFLSEWRVGDVDGDGRDDLLLIGDAGEIRVWHAGREGALLEPEPRGELTLAHPRRTLVALADILGESGRPQLVVLSPDGAVAHRLGEDGAFETAAQPLAARARFQLRTNEPRLAPIAPDVNMDGRPDLVVPGRERNEIWIRTDGELRRAARIATHMDRRELMRAERLNDELLASFRIPRLQTEDLNGDGRPDLIVRSGATRAYHMQRPDGSIPAVADVVLDLDIFKDTTPRADLRPGRIWSGSDQTSHQRRDLDADQIPDYVIAHRRKVWVFHGNRERPQFVEPTTILKVSDDVSALLVLHLDEDTYPDLLLVKVQIPSVASIVAGLVAGLEIEISALGYRNDGGRDFERRPAWRSQLTVRLPNLIKLMKNPGELLGRVEDVGRKFRAQRIGDLTGNGAKDVLLLSENRRRIEIWLGTGDAAEQASLIDLEQTVREIVFEDPDRRWTIDRMLAFVAGFAERRTSGLTGARAPDRTLDLRDPARYALQDFELANLDGREGVELVVRYGPLDASEGPIFDIISFAPG